LFFLLLYRIQLFKELETTAGHLGLALLEEALLLSKTEDLGHGLLLFLLQSAPLLRNGLPVTDGRDFDVARSLRTNTLGATGRLPVVHDAPSIFLFTSRTR
jgi:hypothetical protein